jgi:hypothetical protein
MDPPGRMHWFRLEGLITAVIEFSLNPVVLFLLPQPFSRQEFATERVPTSFEEFDHRQSVITLTCLDPQPWPNSSKERFGGCTCWAPPVPRGSRIRG